MKRRGSWEAPDSVPWTAFGDAPPGPFHSSRSLQKSKSQPQCIVSVMSHMSVFLKVPRTQVFERIDITITWNHYEQRT